MAIISNNFIKTPFTQLSEEVADFIKKVPSDKLFKLEDAVSTYTAFSKTYQSLDQKIFQFTMDSPVDAVTSIELRDSLEKCHKVFTNAILSKFPHAEIPYGDPCVGKVKVNNLASADLRDKFPSIRDIRGDGNCFWTALTVSYLEFLSQDKDRFNQAATEVLDDKDFPSAVKESILETLSHISKDHSQESLEKIFAVNHKILPFVLYFKMKASTYIKEHKDDFAPFIIDTTLDKYCENHVQAMGEFAEHHAILAISKSLNFPFAILDLKANASYETLSFHDAKEKPKTHLCRFKEHYTLCYAYHHKSEEKKVDILESLSDALKAKNMDTARQIHDQLGKTNLDLRNRLHGKLYEVVGKYNVEHPSAQISRDHKGGDFGRVGFRNEEGFDIPFDLKLAALAALKI